MAEETPFPPQHQAQPGREHEMTPMPEVARRAYKGSEKLLDKVAIVTGGDSGIGRSVAVHFAREGADVTVAYLEEDADAEGTRRLVEAEGRRCHLARGDLGQRSFCDEVVARTLGTFGHLDILVNNAGEQHKHEDFMEVTPEEWDRVFRTNVHAYFWLARSAVPHMKPGASIINTTSVNAYKGNPTLIAYTATKAAEVGMTRSMALSLMKRGIRVNGVAPGPIWTPLIPATFSEEKVAEFGKQCPMGRAGQPDEVAPSFVFLASDDASYFTGQVLHPNGGYVVNA